jgi:L-fuconolactonase
LRKTVVTRRDFKTWHARLAALAENPGMFIKLSGILTEGEPGGSDGVERVAEAVLALFGPDRVVWGSDWPVVTLPAEYDEWLSLSRGICARLAPGCEDGVFQQNAMRFYCFS